MKPSSPEVPVDPTMPADQPVPAQRTATAAPAAPDVATTPAAGPEFRPARLDQPLGRRLLAPGYADAALEDVIAAGAAKAREAARAHGYAAGWAQGSQAAAARAAMAEQQRQDQLEQDRRAIAARGQSLVAALAEAVRRQQQSGVPDWHEVSDALADGALALAAAAIGRELASVDEPVAEAVRVAVRALGDPDRVAIHLHPQDVAVLGLADLPPGVRLVPDPQVPAGAVHAQTPAQRLVLNLPAAVAAAEEVLRT